VPAAAAEAPKAAAGLEPALRSILGAQELPPKLAAAVQHAVFGGGGRLRPQLCLAVYAACTPHHTGSEPVWLSPEELPAPLATAAAVELLHCASLVHDDLPCFDDADLRRGRPSVHRQFGEGLAVLAGDALIVAAFAACLLPGVPRAVGRAVGQGAARLIGGQGMESEPALNLSTYHAHKTGSLFALAAACGALCAAVDPQLWEGFGQGIGLAYQLADDLSDAAEDAQPNWARRRGVDRSQQRLAELLVQLEGQAAACLQLAGETTGGPFSRWSAHLLQRLHRAAAGR
jgi:geranylgeranyl diphosphate synthase type II